MKNKEGLHWGEGLGGRCHLSGDPKAEKKDYRGYRYVGALSTALAHGEPSVNVSDY